MTFSLFLAAIALNKIISTERYHLNPDDTMTLTVERPGHHALLLFFERQ